MYPIYDKYWFIHEYLLSLYNNIIESDKLLNPPNGGDIVISSFTFSKTTIDKFVTKGNIEDGYLAIVDRTGIRYSSVTNSYSSLIYFSN